MLKIKYSKKEENRLTALYSYNILDTPAEPIFDNIVGMAANICETPISYISLIDENRCWLKAKIGIRYSELPRTLSCDTYLLKQSNKMLIIEDAFTDYRFRNGPLVHSNRPIRFFAGTPLVNREGHVIGTLGIADYVPRKLLAEQEIFLKDLAKEVMVTLEERRNPSA